MGQTAGIQKYPVTRSARPVQGFDEHALVCAVLTLDLAVEFLGEGTQVAVDVIERFSAIRLRFARAKRVEVRTMQHQDAWHQVCAPNSISVLTMRRSSS